MDNETEYYESFEEALFLTIKKSGRSIKEVAHHLWPKDDPHIVHSRLLEGLNPKKKQRLSFTEAIAICKFCDHYDALYYFADECFHNRPTRKSYEVEIAELTRMMDKGYAKMTKLYQRYLRTEEQYTEEQRTRKAKREDTMDNLSYLEDKKRNSR